MFRIYFETALLYNDVLNSEEGKNGLSYLIDRGISHATLNENLIGFAPKSKTRQFLYSNLIKKYSVLDILSSGIITVNESEGILRDYFGSQRIIFPIFENGNVITFSGRTILSGVEPRYKTFHPSFIGKIGVFNSSVIKKNPSKIYICEGVIDALTMLEMGFDALGIIGTKVFGKENLPIFNGYTGDIVLLFDNDSNGSGQNAVEKLAKLFHSNGMFNIYAKYLEKSNDENKIDINSFYLKNKNLAFAKISNLPQIKIDVKEIEKEKSRSKFQPNSTSYDIVSEIEKITELKNESSSKMRCKCPFPDHSDSSPSFVVYVEDNRFKCFGCGRGGDTIQFVREYYGYGYLDAINYLNGINKE